MPLFDDKPLIIELLDEHIFQLDKLEVSIDPKEDWDMVIYFYGSRCDKSGGVGVVFIIPQGVPIPYSFKLNFPCINNNTEYESLILAIKTTMKLKSKRVKFIGDSLLIMNEVKRIFQCSKCML